jgi:hypothetical protein
LRLRQLLQRLIFVRQFLAGYLYQLFWFRRGGFTPPLFYCLGGSKTGFDINPEDECGRILATISDPRNLLLRLLERAFSDEPQLVELDWFGDTTFNRSMWQAVARQVRTAEDEELVNGVKELAERCQSSVHLYLKFVGD